jgi:hypothetical protein
MNHPSRGELIDELSSWNVGGGIVTMALFPLALPGLVLALAAALPLLALAIPVLVIAGIGVGAFRLVRGLGRLAGRFRRRERSRDAEVPPRSAPEWA